MSSKKKIHLLPLRLGIVFILFSIICTLVWILLPRKVHAPEIPTPFSLPIPSLTPSPLSSLNYAKPTIKEITIRTTADLNRTYGNPPFELLTGGDHYLFQENGFNPERFLTISYDGEQIYGGYDLDVYNSLTSLSPDGTHYLYVRRNAEGLSDIYINQKKVQTVSHVFNEAAVANTGDYYYLTSQSASSSDGMNMVRLFKNGQELLSFNRVGFGETLTISPDGKHYVLWTRAYTEENWNDHFYIDGKKVTLTNKLRELYLSKNWQHYAIISGDGYEKSIRTLSIDGKIVEEVPGFLALGELLDNGSYSYYRNGPFINNIRTSYPIVKGKPYPFLVTKALMTEDGKHVLTQDRDKKWKFDGKEIAITTPGKWDKVEIVGDTIYVYHITN